MSKNAMKSALLSIAIIIIIWYNSYVNKLTIQLANAPRETTEVLLWQKEQKQKES